MHQQILINDSSNLTKDHIALAELLASLVPGRRKEILTESPLIMKHLERVRREQRNRKNSFTFIDLFAGVGGVRLGFESAGGKCVMTSELDYRAQATYFCNFGEAVEPRFRDITQINPSEVPDHDVLLAGFPCQAFSIAGERKGFQDTRGTLFFDIQRVIAEKKPKVLFLENVKGLIGHDSGRTFTVIQSILEQLGYSIFFKVLNTMDYGNVPQTRERIYIVGFNREHFGDEVYFEFPKPIPLKKKISDCLIGRAQDESLFYDGYDIYPTLKKELKKIDTVYQWRRVYVRENKSNVCPTLTANMGTGGHNVPLILEKGSDRIRKLSPRECANFQGFPNDFYIPKFLANSHLYKQFGNSVSVPVVSRIASRIAGIFEHSLLNG